MKDCARERAASESDDADCVRERECERERPDADPDAEAADPEREPFERRESERPLARWRRLAKEAREIGSVGHAGVRPQPGSRALGKSAQTWS